MYTRRGKQICLFDATGASYVIKEDDSLDCHVVDLIWHGCSTDFVRNNSYKDEAAMAFEEINSSRIDRLLACIIEHALLLCSERAERSTDGLKDSS